MLSWLHSLPDHHPRERSTLRASDLAGGRRRWRMMECGQSYGEVLGTSQGARVNKAPTASYGTPRSQLTVTGRQTGRRLRKSSRPRAHPLPPEHSTHVHTHSQAHTHTDAHTPMHIHAHTSRHRCTHPHTRTPMQHAQGCTRRSLGPPGCMGAFSHPALHVHPFLLGAKGPGTVTSHGGPALTLCGHTALFSCAAPLLCVCSGSMVAWVEGTAGAPE